MRTVGLVALMVALAIAPALAVPNAHAEHGKDPQTEPPGDKPTEPPIERTPPRTVEQRDPRGEIEAPWTTWGVVRRARPAQLVFGPWMRPAPECADYVRRFPTLYACVRAAW